MLEKDGSVTHRLLKVPNEKVEEWDRTHDDAGNVLGDEAHATGNDHGLLKRVKVREGNGVSGVTEKV